MCCAANLVLLRPLSHQPFIKVNIAITTEITLLLLAAVSEIELLISHYYLLAHTDDYFGRAKALGPILSKWDTEVQHYFEVFYRSPDSKVIKS